MISICAIDPQIMGEWGWFNFLEPHFGVSCGRLIAEFPKKWRALVLERAKDLEQTGVNKPLQRLRIEERLRSDYFRRKLISTGNANEADKSWEANAVNGGFDLVIVAGERKPGKVRGVESLEFCPQDIETRRQSNTPMEHQAIFGCAGLMLQKTRRIVLVDPNFRIIADRWANSLAAMLARLPHDLQHDCLVEVHTERTADHARAVEARLWSEKLERRVPQRVQIKCVYWDRLPRDQKMHPRFLLTDRGGLHYDYGFDAQPGQEQLVSLLDDSYWGTLWEIYDASKLPENFDTANCVVERLR